MYDCTEQCSKQCYVYTYIHVHVCACGILFLFHSPYLYNYLFSTRPPCVVCSGHPDHLHQRTVQRAVCDHVHTGHDTTETGTSTVYSVLGTSVVGAILYDSF